MNWSELLAAATDLQGHYSIKNSRFHSTENEALPEFHVVEKA